MLAALGARDPQGAAEAFVALLDGFALHRLARPRDPEREAAALFAAMRALFLEQVMDADARASCTSGCGGRPIGPQIRG